MYCAAICEQGPCCWLISFIILTGIVNVIKFKKKVAFLSFLLRVAYPECKTLITLPGVDKKSGIKWFGPALKCCFSFNLYHYRQCLSLTDVHEPPSVHFACVYSWSDDPKSLFEVSSTAECLSYWHTYCSTELEQLTCYVIHCLTFQYATQT